MKLPLNGLSATILDMMDGEPSRITLLIRDFLPHIQNVVEDSRDSLVEAGPAAVDRLTIVGSTLVLTDRQELFCEVLEQMRDIYAYIDNTSSISEDAIKILFALGISWNTLGALLIRERKYAWLPNFLSYTTISDPHNSKLKGWFHHLHGYIYQANLFDSALWINPSLSHIRGNDCLFKFFKNDQTMARSLLCQFEFVQCLFYRYHGMLSHPNPGYCQFNNDFTLPIVRVILNDNDMRITLFGEDYDTNKVQQCEKDLLLTCLHRYNVSYSS